MPGVPFMHGVQTSTSPLGEGGANRVSNAHPQDVQSTDNLTFFIWLAVLGIIVPVAILGGLQLGGFKFVYKGR